MTTASIGFQGLAALAVIGALVLILTARTTVGAAMGAVLCQLALAGLFTLLAAPFLGLAQLLLVIGAAGVGLLFVVLLVDLESAPLPARSVRRRVLNGLGVIAATSLAGVVLLTLASTPRPNLPVDAGLGSVFALGETLYREFAAPLVGLSLILLVGLVASRVLSDEGDR